MDFSGCDHHIPTVKVRITNHLYHSESVEFEFLKTELSTRRTAVVLGFNIEPSARKQFYFQQSSSILRFSQRRLVDYYELEIECDYQPSWTQHIVFGSEVQKHGQNGINIPIYEIEMMAFCSRGKIRLVIYNAERERTEIDVTRKFLLDNNAFNINMSNETVQPISQRRTENDDPVLSRTIAWRGASSSTTGHTEASTMATAHDEAITLSQAGDTESEVDEMEPKQQSEKDEAVSEQNICKICLNKKREIAFVPCGHFCACREWTARNCLLAL
uniref:RING-type domain-containing protein n=1 Tax=Globodera pallida TaxID=36090 RepID=A0A183CDY1_GLOPA